VQDTNQYIANYSMAGPLTPATANDVVETSLTFLETAGTSGADPGYTPPPAPSPGALRWGRGQGCDFVNKNARTWAPQWTCNSSVDNTVKYGCTADNLMSAVCVIQNTYTAEPSCASEGNFQANQGPTCGLSNDACSGGACKIATVMRWFTSDDDAVAAYGTGATAATTAGFSNAMDYVPVQVGYWSCRDSSGTANSANSTLGGESVNLHSISSLFGSASDMSLFGGQAHCENCRCFRSSLLELTKSINPSFPIYGLCYR
jgi:hypothetical protein